MPSKKSQPSWQVILEEIRSQNRSTIEAVEAARVSLEQRIDRLDQDSRSRDGVLELAIRANTSEIRELKAQGQQNTIDIRELRVGGQDVSASVQGLGAAVQGLGAAVQGLGTEVQELRSSVQELRSAVQQNTVDIRDLKTSVHENSVDLRGLTTRVEALARIEERVAALERRAAS